MELITPGPGLILWQAIIVLSILSFIVAWMMILVTNKLEAAQKLVWLIGTLFLPVVGPLLFFIKYPSFRKANL